jgi:hypothetical protein
VLTFDSAAVSRQDGDVAPDSLGRDFLGRDSLARDSLRVATPGSLSAALVAARRLGPLLAAGADSVELVIVSPVAAHELDVATDSVRARWPGRIQILRLAVRQESARPWTLERALDTDDPLRPALVRVGAGAGPTAVRLRRIAPTAADSTYARGGGAVVRWDIGAGADASRFAPAALAMGDDVVVATLGRMPLPVRGRTIARWGDGSAAASEEPVGAGCFRHVGIGLPVAGDLPLRPVFQRVVRGLLAPCGRPTPTIAADSVTIARLSGTGSLAAARALAGPEHRRSPLVPWLLGLALLCAVAELVVRARSARELA